MIVDQQGLAAAVFRDRALYVSNDSRELEKYKEVLTTTRMITNLEEDDDVTVVTLHRNP
jgi:transcriptional/translational regulatory protein YebC/TACO1